MKKSIVFLIVLFSFQLIGCRSIKYVPVPEYHYETIHQTDTFRQRDSIYCQDSIYVEKTGDTVVFYKTKIVYRDRWRDRIIRDSICKVDTIRIPYPVEKKLTMWQKTKLRFSKLFVVCLAVCFSWLIIRLVKKMV